MVPIARRHLLADRPRLALSVAAVALSITLVLLLGGLVSGMFLQITAYIDHSPAQFVVAQKGVTNFLGAGSIIARDAVEEAAGVSGVVSAVPVLVRGALLTLNGHRTQVVLIGYEPREGGGPWALSAGRDVKHGHEVVVDRVMAQREHLRVGDQLEILDKTFTIVGLSEGTAYWLASKLFLRHDTMAELVHARNATSYVMVKTDSTPGVEKRLRAALPDFDILPKEAVAHNDREMLSSGFGLPLRLMVGIAVVIGALLVGLTIYSATVERAREYGVLKAIGMQNASLYGIVLKQALGAVLLGSALGLCVTWLLIIAFQRFLPQFLILLDRNAIAQAAGGALVIAGLASLIPARWVARLDPADVFRR